MLIFVENVFSVSKACDRGYDFILTNNGNDCKFLKNQVVVAIGRRSRNSFLLDLIVSHEDQILQLFNLQQFYDPKIWYKCLGAEILNDFGYYLFRKGKVLFCDNELHISCAHGKYQYLPFTAKQCATKAAEIVYSDVCGPWNIRSIDQPLTREIGYFLIFKHDFTKSIHYYMMKDAKKMSKFIRKYWNRTRLQFGEGIGELRTDSNKHYQDSQVQKLLKNLGIKHTIMIENAAPEEGKYSKIDSKSRLLTNILSMFLLIFMGVLIYPDLKLIVSKLFKYLITLFSTLPIILDNFCKLFFKATKCPPISMNNGLCIVLVLTIIVFSFYSQWFLMY